jgi:hypothetical protein
MFQGK